MNRKIIINEIEHELHIVYVIDGKMVHSYRIENTYLIQLRDKYHKLGYKDTLIRRYKYVMEKN